METASTTTKDFEAQEVQDILKLLVPKPLSFYGRMKTPIYFDNLITVLVANGTLTSAQVKRALKKDEEL